MKEGKEKYHMTPHMWGLRKSWYKLAHSQTRNRLPGLENELTRAGAGQSGAWSALHTRCVLHTREQPGPSAQHTGLRSGSWGRLGAGGEGTRACVHGRTLHHIPETLTTLLRTNEVVSKIKWKVKEERTGGTSKCWPADGTTPRERNSDSRELLTRAAFQ